jgi:hypothetical protein
MANRASSTRRRRRQPAGAGGELWLVRNCDGSRGTARGVHPEGPEGLAHSLPQWPVRR